MSDAETLALTASEPLSLPEEYEMQQSWRLDSDKLTFIVATTSNEEVVSLESCRQCMIGDVNMFLQRLDDDNDQNLEDGGQDRYTGELELMIAEKSARRHGYGRSALLLFMAYILTHASQITTGRLSSFSVKIGDGNQASLALFEALGFVKVKYSDFFQESELSFVIDETSLSKITQMMRLQDVAWQEILLDG